MLTQTGINDEAETLAGWLAILRRQLIQKRSGNRPQAIIRYPATRAQVKPSENHKACNKRCIALAVWWSGISNRNHNNNKNKLNELQTTRNRRRSENCQNIIERQRSTQQARLALLEQASQVASKRRQRFHEQADQMQASKQQTIHRVRSQLLISSPNRIMSSELPQASNNGTQQVGRQRRKSMSNDEPNNKSEHETL